jgi:hypothetical protein
MAGDRMTDETREKLEALAHDKCDACGQLLRCPDDADWGCRGTGKKWWPLQSALSWTDWGNRSVTSDTDMVVLVAAVEQCLGMLGEYKHTYYLTDWDFHNKQKVNPSIWVHEYLSQPYWENREEYYKGIAEDSDRLVAALDCLWQAVHGHK